MLVIGCNVVVAVFIFGADGGMFTFLPGPVSDKFPLPTTIYRYQIYGRQPTQKARIWEKFLRGFHRYNGQHENFK